MDDPTGAEMVERTEKVKDRVKHIITEYPQTKGDDLQLVWRYYQVYTNVRIKFSVFKDLLMCPSPETIRRRRQEIQAIERNSVDAGVIRLEECQYLPTAKTLKKRKDYRTAMTNYHGRCLKLTDFE